MYLDKLCTRGMALSLTPEGNLRLRSDRPPSAELRKWIKEHKHELINELSYLIHEHAESDLHEAQEERRAIMEESGEDPEAIERATANIRHVACVECQHDKSDGDQCRAGYVRVERHHTGRVCGRFTRPSGAGN